MKYTASIEARDSSHTYNRVVTSVYITIVKTGNKPEGTAPTVILAIL
jgi:hypothetical protein